MLKRIVSVSGLLAIATVAAGGIALAQHGSPPQYISVDTVVGITFSVESAGGEVYHDNASAGTSGTQCTATTGDDGATDDTRECYHDRNQLKDKDTGADEGGNATCTLVPGTNLGPNQIVFDGVFLDECGPPAGGNTTGRAYTGVAVAGVGNGGLAAGGNAGARSGCVQAFGEDDTSGNYIKMGTDRLQSAGGTPHSGSDDDSDVSLCGDLG